MEQLPADILGQVVPDARGWVMLSNTSHTMRAQLRAAVYDSFNSAVLSFRAITTRAYVILFNKTLGLLEFRYADGSVKSGKTMTRTPADVMAILYFGHGLQMLLGITMYDSVYALVAADIRIKPIAVTVLTPKLCKGAGTPVAMLMKYVDCFDKYGITAYRDDGVGVGVVRCHPNSRATYIDFNDGETFGIGAHLYVIGEKIVGSSLPPRELFKKLPQLAGRAHPAELLF